jgi:SmpA/OmlA family protein
MKLLFTTFMTTAALALSGCHAGGRLTKANVDEVSEGMSKKQVESILGPPSAIDTTDLILLKKTTYTYRQGQDTVTVVFKDDKVQSKESTLTQ